MSTDTQKQFTTIKVSERLRRWIKLEAARQDVPMYVFVEQVMAKGVRGKPWEQGGGS